MPFLPPTVLLLFILSYLRYEDKDSWPLKIWRYNKFLVVIFLVRQHCNLLPLSDKVFSGSRFSLFFKAFPLQQQIWLLGFVITAISSSFSISQVSVSVISTTCTSTTIMVYSKNLHSICSIYVSFFFTAHFMENACESQEKDGKQDQNNLAFY